MASFSGHLWGGMIATGASIALVGAGMYYTGHLTPYLVLDEWIRLPLLVAVGLLSAFFPDIDTGSKSQRILYGVMLIGDITLIWQHHYESAALLGLLAMIPPLGKHRGWTHAWTTAVAAPAVVFFGFPLLMNREIHPFLVACYFVSVSGYVSHLALDGYIGSTARKAGKILKRRR